MLWETILLALREIRRNVLRSSLTTLGIVIGVGAVITMVTLGNGATAQVTSDISSLGSNLLQIRPGQGRRGPGGKRSEAKDFKIDDAKAIARETFGVSAVAPVSSKGVQAIYGNENWSTTVSGSTNGYFTVCNWTLDKGRKFTQREQKDGRAVCILGESVRKELFGAQNPVGATIRLEKLSLRVVGLCKAKGQSGIGPDRDDFILMPLRTFQRRIMGDKDVKAIYVSARDGVSTTKVKEDMERLMRERRKIKEGGANDFHVRDMQEIMSAVTGATLALTALLGAVAAVSLLVGGIGIMNIMLVSVTERTREIGTRLAIGALEGEVLMQFLVEAVVLSCFGGFTGIVLGLSAAKVGAALLELPFIVSPGIVVVAFLFSGLVGIVFGYFPARKAARLDPIEALRHE